MTYIYFKISLQFIDYNYSIVDSLVNTIMKELENAFAKNKYFYLNV